MDTVYLPGDLPARLHPRQPDSLQRRVEPVTWSREAEDTLQEIRDTPLDLISVKQADDLVRDVFDRHSEELPVGVARFGSAI